MGALGPLVKVVGYKQQWLRLVIIYTLAGTVVSAGVGGLLGGVGGWLVPAQLNDFHLPIALAVGGLAVGRDLGWVAIPLPQVRRQTNRSWARGFAGPRAALFWGMDLGLIFSTWQTFAGAWFLAIVAVLVANPVGGAALFASYWLGRAMSVWLAPMIFPSASATPQVLNAIHSEYILLRKLHVVGLGWAIIVLMVWMP